MIWNKSLVVLALTAALVGAAGKPASAVFDKARFATDLGVAFFAFHHWGYAPYKAGTFASGAPHRTKALVKAGVALPFTANRLKAANKIVHTTKDPSLQKLGGMIESLTGSFSSVGQRMKAGQFKPEDATGIDSAVKSITSDASAAGVKVKDVPVTIPGT
jgi:hypothetical protein